LLDDDAPLWPFYESYHLDVVKSAGSKAVRRLDKTQVFIQQNNNPLIRNRKTHTEEVVLLARQIAYFLGLNVYLVEAIALTHDFGHTPFGHLGEIVISEISQREFLHAVMSVVIAQKIERRGQGLNLSWETLEGVLRHSRGKNGLKAEPGFALEYAVVMLADKIAYTFSDLNDAIRAGYFQETQLPKEFFILGANQRERMLNCLFALVQESSEKQTISFCDSEVAGQFESLRQWSYVNFYEALNYEEERIKAKNDLKRVYSFFNDWLVKYYHYDPLLALALLTDNEAMEIAKFADKPMLSDLKRLSDFSFMEILGRLPQDNKIDIFDPDLNVKEFSN
jgi:dGTPase